MPTFVYKAKRGPEKFEDGEITAASQDQAILKLEDMGLSPISVVEKETKPSDEIRGHREGVPSPLALLKASGEPSRTTHKAGGDQRLKQGLQSIKVRTKDVDTFTWQLASLVRARVPILRALSLITKQTENTSMRTVVHELEKQVRDGKTLSDGLRQFPRIFNNLFVNIVKSGEQGGALHEVLYRVAEYREKEQAVKRRIQAAMAYPLVMIVVGSGTIFLMLAVFLPKFIDLFANMREELPAPTKVLIGISSFTSENWHWFIIALILVFAVFGRVKPSSKKKFFLDMMKLHIPVVKKLVRDAEIAKFSRTLGLLLKNGLSVYESLQLATDTLENEALRSQLTAAGEEIVQQGSSLSSSLNKIKIFPEFAVNMIAVGEEGGKLEESLSGIANAYEKEVDQAVSVMTSLLEPFLILFIGAVVGFIVFAMLLPVFNIGLGAK